MKAQILSPTPKNLERVANRLREGDVCGMPTETVYGLAGGLWNLEALIKIFEAKERPKFDPLIIHLSTAFKDLGTLRKGDLVDFEQLTPSAIRHAFDLINQFWPGPLTLILPKHPKVPDLATSGMPTVALRIPDHPVAQDLLRAAAMPLAAPSANRFGRISPTCAQDVFEELGDRIEWILDGGRCQVGVESTIVAIDVTGEVSLLRPGGIPTESIEGILGIQLKSSAAPLTTSGENLLSLSAPGMLLSHYAPGKPLFLLKRSPSGLALFRGNESISIKTLKQSKIGLLLLSEISLKEIQSLFRHEGIARTLSSSGDPSEIAKNLFAGLRYMDSSNVEVILAELCPTESGLGHAINDRLRKAAGQPVPKSPT